MGTPIVPTLLQSIGRPVDVGTRFQRDPLPNLDVLSMFPIASFRNVRECNFERGIEVAFPLGTISGVFHLVGVGIVKRLLADLPLRVFLKPFLEELRFVVANSVMLFNHLP